MDWTLASRLPLLLLCLASAAVPLREARTEDLIACPRCDEDGQLECPDCRGSGKDEETCHVCDGAGERPCKVCSKESNAAGPGRLTCSPCRGTGRSASGRELCHRCRGVQSTACPSCLGRGTRPCSESIVRGSCPTCRRRGTIDCPVCGGDHQVSRSALAERSAALRALPRASDEPDGGSSRHSARAADLDVSTSGSETGERATISNDALLERYNALVTAHGDHLDLLAVDPRPALETVRRNATNRLRELEDETTAVTGLDARTLRAEIVALIDRLKNFHGRWGDLRAIFEKELKTFRTVKDTARRRREVLEATPAALRESEEARLNERLDRALRICESFAAELAQDGPAWTAREEELMRESWSELEKESDRYLAAVAEAQALAGAREDEKQKEGDRARAAAAQREMRLAAARRERIAAAGEARPEAYRAEAEAADEEAADEEAAPETIRPDRATPEAERAGDAPAGETQVAHAAAGRSESDAPPASSGLPAYIWGLAGFALATVIFLAFNRSRRTAGVD